MKLIQEYINKISIGIFILAILMDLYVLFLLIIKAPKLFNHVYEETILKCENKSISITQKIEEYVIYTFMKYKTDLKLICKHALLFNGKKLFSDLNTINRDSNIFINNNKVKHIAIAKMDELNKFEYLKNLFNYEKNFYNYIDNYEELFNKDSIGINFILKKLFSNEHEELNTIGYFNMLNENKIFSKEEEMNIKFIISILKSVYIKRYIVRRKNIEYSRFYILNKEEIFLYPPEAYNNSLIYYFQNEYGSSVCNYSSTNISLKFPLCIYNYITNKSLDKEKIYCALIYEKLIYGRIFILTCLKIPFIKNNPQQAILCLELDLSKFFSTSNFKIPKNLEYGMFAYDMGFIFPLINSYNNKLAEIHNAFNDFEIEKYRTVEQGIFYFFHFLYYGLVQTVKNRTDIKLNYTKIEEEYNIINEKIIHEIENFNENVSNKIIITFNKTVCRNGFTINEYECYQDEFKIIILPLNLTVKLLNEDYLETKDEISRNLGFYTYTIISTNPKTNKNKMNTLIVIKGERAFILFLLTSLVIFFSYIYLINIISENSLNSINKIKNQLTLKSFELKSNRNEYRSLNENKEISLNKEISRIKNIYEIMRKILIIKLAFNDENYLAKHNVEFYNMVQNISKKDIKEVCNSLIGFYHYQNKEFNLAENEFKCTILYIQELENKLIRDKNNEYNDKIKDAIKRSSTVSYINEYSVFSKVDENIYSIIKIKIYKQRFMYLYAMTKFKLGKGDNNNSNVDLNFNKNKRKKEKAKKENYFKESIKYFKECKNINNLLGINQIKIIYCLIMISKCYLQFKDYRNAINNIIEALNLYFEFSKSFKNNHYKNYNPKVMMFIENNIFHFILFNIERICYFYNKPNACNWIIIKIFETSPFLLSNIHYQSAFNILNYLEKNKMKITKAEIKNISKTILVKQYKKSKRYYSKIISRMNIKKINNKSIEETIEKNSIDNSNSTSFKTKIDSKLEKSNYSSTFRRDAVTGKITTSLNAKRKNLNKIITICLMEKILKKVNGLELKDVLIKNIMKYFETNENDKFSFIQFATNGKKTVFIKEEPLNDFIQKIFKTNNAFELFDSYNKNTNFHFTELFNVLNSIIKNFPTKEENINDNIIIMFINSDDIRFTSIDECLNIVEKLNKKNTSLYLLTYDKIISKEKINNIHSFLNGLFEGYLFQIKNYQQIKQIFINLSIFNYQSNFFGYNFNTKDNEL